MAKKPPPTGATEETPPEEPLYWVASSLGDLKEMPDSVKETVGYALHMAQHGERHHQTKVMRGFGGAGVLEIFEDFDGNTYRAVYTLKCQGAIYVLHCFKKKSKKGIATPKVEMDLINKRLVHALAIHEEKYGKKPRKP